MSLTESPPKPLSIEHYDHISWAPKNKLHKTSRVIEPHNAKKIATYFALSPVRPTIEETDIDDLLGADDGTPTTRVLIEVIDRGNGMQLFLFDNGTYEFV